MPYKDPEKMAEYMRQRRAAKSGKVNVNPVNRKPVNPKRKISQVSGSYEEGSWMGICPVCILHNRMDPKRSYRPVEICDHFQQLRIPGKASEFIFNRPLIKLTHESVNPLTQNVNPVNQVREKYILSYSRNKYQYVLYAIDSSGSRSLIRSCKKNEKLQFGPCEIELTWGPDIQIEPSKEAQE